MAIERYFENVMPFTPYPELYKGKDVKLVNEVWEFLYADGLEANLTGAVANGTRQYNHIGIRVTPRRINSSSLEYQSAINNLREASEGERKLYDWIVENNSQKNKTNGRSNADSFTISKPGTKTRVDLKFGKRNTHNLG